MAKVTYDDMLELVKEIERGAKDKNRTLASVTNPTVKNMLASESSMAIKAGVTASVLGASSATGTLIGTIGGAGAGVAASSLTALGAATVGATAGSVVPIVGTAVGAVVGLAGGIYIGSRNKKKNNKEKEMLHQEVLKNQNTIIRDLEKELTELKQKYAEKVEQNERYKYVIKLLMSNEELKHCA